MLHRDADQCRVSPVREVGHCPEYQESSVRRTIPPKNCPTIQSCLLSTIQSKGLVKVLLRLLGEGAGLEF